MQSLSCSSFYSQWWPFRGLDESPQWNWRYNEERCWRTLQGVSNVLTHIISPSQSWYASHITTATTADWLTLWKCECHTILFFFFTFGLLPSDVPQPITCLRLTPSSWASSFLTQIYKLTVIFHKIHKSPFRFSSKLPACHFEPQGPSTQIFTVLLLNMFCLKQSQFGHSGYTSKSI